MAGKSRKLTVSLSFVALTTLDEIWLWNCQSYGMEHAHEYVAFLRAETTKLETMFFLAKTVPSRPRLGYIVIRRHRKGHGHIAVFQLSGEVIDVLNYYHTAQDWQTRVSKDFG